MEGGANALQHVMPNPEIMEEGSGNALQLAPIPELMEDSDASQIGSSPDPWEGLHFVAKAKGKDDCDDSCKMLLFHQTETTASFTDGKFIYVDDKVVGEVGLPAIQTTAMEALEKLGEQYNFVPEYDLAHWDVQLESFTYMCSVGEDSVSVIASTTTMAKEEAARIMLLLLRRIGLPVPEPWCHYLKSNVTLDYGNSIYVGLLEEYCLEYSLPTPYYIVVQEDLLQDPPLSVKKKTTIRTKVGNYFSIATKYYQQTARATAAEMLYKHFRRNRICKDDFDEEEAVRRVRNQSKWNLTYPKSQNMIPLPIRWTGSRYAFYVLKQFGQRLRDEALEIIDTACVYHQTPAEVLTAALAALRIAPKWGRVIYGSDVTVEIPHTMQLHEFKDVTRNRAAAAAIHFLKRGLTDQWWIHEEDNEENCIRLATAEAVKVIGAVGEDEYVYRASEPDDFTSTWGLTTTGLRLKLQSGSNSELTDENLSKPEVTDDGDHAMQLSPDPKKTDDCDDSCKTVLCSKAADTITFTDGQSIYINDKIVGDLPLPANTTAKKALQKLGKELNFEPKYDLIPCNLDLGYYVYKCTAGNYTVTVIAYTISVAKEEAARIMLMLLTKAGHPVPEPWCHYLKSNVKLQWANSMYVGLLEEYCLEYGLPTPYYVATENKTLPDGPFSEVKTTIRAKVGNFFAIATKYYQQSARMATAEMLYRHLKRIRRSKDNFDERAAAQRVLERTMWTTQYHNRLVVFPVPVRWNGSQNIFCGLIEFDERTRYQALEIINSACVYHQTPVEVLTAAVAALGDAPIWTNLYYRSCVRVEIPNTNEPQIFEDINQNRAAANAILFLKHILTDKFFSQMHDIAIPKKIKGEGISANNDDETSSKNNDENTHRAYDPLKGIHYAWGDTASAVVLELGKLLSCNTVLKLVSEVSSEKTFTYKCSLYGQHAKVMAGTEYIAKEEAARIVLLRMARAGCTIPAPWCFDVIRPIPEPVDHIYVGLLQEYCLEYRLSTPEFILMGETGPAPDCSYTMRTRVNFDEADYTGPDKEDARQASAQILYTHFRRTLFTPEDFDEDAALERVYDNDPLLFKMTATAQDVEILTGIDGELRCQAVQEIRTACQYQYTPVQVLTNAVAFLGVEPIWGEIPNPLFPTLITVEIPNPYKRLMFTDFTRNRVAGNAMEYLALCLRDENGDYYEVENNDDEGV